MQRRGAEGSAWSGQRVCPQKKARYEKQAFGQTKFENVPDGGIAAGRPARPYLQWTKRYVDFDGLGHSQNSRCRERAPAIAGQSREGTHDRGLRPNQQLLRPPWRLQERPPLHSPRRGDFRNRRITIPAWTASSLRVSSCCST